MNRAATIALAVAVVLGVALQIADRYTPFAGIMPIVHAGNPYGFNFADVPDLRGKTILVTGASSGLGYGTAKIAALHGATVVMTCRTMAKCVEAKRRMLADPNVAALGRDVNDRLVLMVADQTSLKSVKAFVNEYKASGRPIHSLVLNAGIMQPPHELTADGIESQFGVNHVAHFAMTKDLLDVVIKSQPSTIVAVSSIAHYAPVPGGVYLDLATLNDPKNYDPHTYYGQSKLANVLFAKELAKRLEGKQVFVNAVHPGGVRGGLTKHIVTRIGASIAQSVDEFVQSRFYWDEETGALTPLAAAVGPRIFRERVAGKYFLPVGRERPSSALSENATLAKALWDFSERILKEKGW